MSKSRPRIQLSRLLELEYKPRAMDKQSKVHHRGTSIDRNAENSRTCTIVFISINQETAREKQRLAQIPLWPYKQDLHVQEQTIQSICDLRLKVNLSERVRPHVCLMNL